ncbi:hypothetical protein D3C77_312900 [compost metagenome]
MIAALGADFNRGNVFEAHQTFAFFHYQTFEAFDRIEVGVDTDVGNHQGAFDLSGCCLVVVVFDGPINIGSSNAVRCHAQRVQPDAHRQVLSAQHVDGRHTFDGGQHGAGDAHQVVGDAGQRLALFRAETGIDDPDRAGCLTHHYRVVGFFGK